MSEHVRWLRGIVGGDDAAVREMFEEDTLTGTPEASMKRRDFLRASGSGAMAALASTAGCISGRPTDSHEDLRAALARAGSDEAYWRAVRAFYEPPADYIDLDHANSAPTPRPVFDAFVERARRLSHAPAEGFGTMWNNELGMKNRAPLARFLGTQPEHLAFVANTTFAMNTVLHGFPLVAGDEILITDHEYPDMIETVLQRTRRDGVVMRRVQVPGPMHDGTDLVLRVRDAITPRTKLLLISHVSAWNGEVLPVAAVTAEARARGVAVLVDAAQSVGIIDVDFDAIGCDFLGASLHKGLGAPLPTGVLIMRPERVVQVRPLHPPSWESAEYPMDRFEWSGTFNMAGFATAAEALEFHQMIGPRRKADRLQDLFEYWQSALQDLEKVRMLTPMDRTRRCGPAAFAVEGVPSDVLTKHLRKSKGVLVQHKAGRHSPFTNAVRVSPAAHATLQELDRFTSSIRDVVRNGVS